MQSLHIRAWASALPSDIGGQCEKPQRVGRQMIQIPTLFLYHFYANEGMTEAIDLDLLNLNLTAQKKANLPKILKITSFVVGVPLIVAGVCLLWKSDNYYGPSKEYSIPGGLLLGAGVVSGTTLFVIGCRQQKKLDRMTFESTSIFEHNVFDNGDKSLTLSANVLSNRMNNRAFGLGMTYTF